MHLALALKLTGRVADAVAVALAAFRRGGNSRAAPMLADCLRVARFEATTPELEASLASLLDVPAIDPADLVPAIVSALRVNAVLAPLLTEAGDDFAGRMRVALGVFDHPLLLRLMTLTVVYDAAFERFFTRARAALLFDGALRREVSCAFLTALAHQCFLVEYVYAESAAEAPAVEALAQEMAGGRCRPMRWPCLRATGRSDASRSPRRCAVGRSSRESRPSLRIR